jgi:uncharacterized protein YdeI (YjbR/CyaY-like superfamily)
MGARIERVDAYIAGSAEFARPILEHLREVVHSTCPESEEAFKWSFPCFMYRGMLCNMAAFKEHCSFGFWKSSLVLGKETKEETGRSMGQFGKITRLSDLPADGVLAGYIREAMRLNEAGIKAPNRAKPKAPRELIVPDDLITALDGQQAARSTFERFSFTNKREYVEWITEAKTEATRSKRLATTIEWLAEGKPRNWKYMNC